VSVHSFLVGFSTDTLSTFSQKSFRVELTIFPFLQNVHTIIVAQALKLLVSNTDHYQCGAFSAPAPCPTDISFAVSVPIF
jgi:hypothetical protein